MTRHRYHTDQADAYLQRPRAGLHSVSRTRPTVSIASRPPQDTIPTGSDGNKGRKRIAVACSRCRKRKIKCSGDLGNGQGCTACKNSGSSPGQCQFLRVSSTEVGGYFSECHSLVMPATYPQPSDYGFCASNYTFHPSTTSSYPVSRLPRHYGSNVYRNPVNLVDPRHGEAMIEPFSYSSPSPPNYSSYYQPTIYGQPETPQYCPSSGFQRAAVYEEGQLKYATGLPLQIDSPVNGQSTGDTSSSLTSLGTMAHSLPGGISAQRSLPTPKNSLTGLPADGAGCGEALMPAPQPILRSQGIGPLESFAAPPIVPSSTAETSCSDEKSSMVPAYSCQLNKAPGASGFFSYLSSYAGNVAEVQSSSNEAGGALTPTCTAGDGSDFGSLAYKSSFAVDAEVEKARRSAQNTDPCLQFIPPSTAAPRQDSQGSLRSCHETGGIGNRRA